MADVSSKVGVLDAITVGTTQSVSDLDFSPRAMFFWTTAEDADGLGADDNGILSLGWSDGTNHWCQGFAELDGYASVVSNCWQRDDACIYVRRMDIATGLGAVDAVATVAFDATGFTLTWSTLPPSAIKVCWAALGGDGLGTTVKAGTFTLTAGTTGALSVTDPGFDPMSVILGTIHADGGDVGDFDAQEHAFQIGHLGSNSTVPPLGIPRASARMMFASYSGRGGGRVANHRAGDVTMSKTVLRGITVAGAETMRVESHTTNGIEANGFRLDVTNAPATDQVIGYIAFSGLITAVASHPFVVNNGDDDETIGTTPSGAPALVIGIGGIPTEAAGTNADGGDTIRAGDGFYFGAWGGSPDDSEQAVSAGGGGAGPTVASDVYEPDHLAVVLNHASGGATRFSALFGGRASTGFVSQIRTVPTSPNGHVRRAFYLILGPGQGRLHLLPLLDAGVG